MLLGLLAIQDAAIRIGVCQHMISPCSCQFWVNTHNLKFSLFLGYRWSFTHNKNCYSVNISDLFGATESQDWLHHLPLEIWGADGWHWEVLVSRQIQLFFIRSWSSGICMGDVRWNLNLVWFYKVDMMWVIGIYIYMYCDQNPPAKVLALFPSVGAFWDCNRGWATACDTIGPQGGQRS
jgi:hypothetical protein